MIECNNNIIIATTDGKCRLIKYTILRRIWHLTIPYFPRCNIKWQNKLPSLAHSKDLIRSLSTLLVGEDINAAGVVSSGTIAITKIYRALPCQATLHQRLQVPLRVPFHLPPPPRTSRRHQSSLASSRGCSVSSRGLTMTNMGKIHKICTTNIRTISFSTPTESRL